MIDISTPVDECLPMWPGSERVRYSATLRIEQGDDANASRIDADLHTGTHIDAPLHFVEGGADVEAVGLGPLVGRAYVATVPSQRRIGARDLDGLDLPEGVERLLLRTANSDIGALREPEFDPDAAALTADGAAWIVQRGITLVGIDYLSIQRVEDGPETHQILLQASVVIVEGLDLRAAPEGHSDLICLPVRLVGCEAAPARAVLFPEGTL